MKAVPCEADDALEESEEARGLVALRSEEAQGLTLAETVDVHVFTCASSVGEAKPPQPSPTFGRLREEWQPRARHGIGRQPGDLLAIYKRERRREGLQAHSRRTPLLAMRALTARSVKALRTPLTCSTFTERTPYEFI